MKALVIGGARSGTGAALLLKKLNYDVTLVSNRDFESRKLLEENGITVNLSDEDTNQYDDVDVVVKNPGIPNTHPLVSRFKHVLNEIDIAVQASDLYDYYAISGTNGKTTTVSLLHEMLLKKDTHALLAGNVGVSLSEKVFEEGNFKRDVALEISAFQMEGTPSLKPKIYALLNLTPDHLDRYDSELDYYKAKLGIIKRSELLIRNIDDENIMNLTHKTDTKTLDMSLRSDADVYIKEGHGCFGDVSLFDVSKLTLVGNHNVMNALVASTMAYLAGVEVASIQEVLYAFKGIEHRLEFVKSINGVRYYNDSKATNPESTEVALKAFDDNIILLAGGFDKKISFDLLKPYASKLKKLYVFGESKYQLKEAFPEAELVENLDEAVFKARNLSKTGDVVLLSPACASYDQYQDYEQRGNHFKNLIKDQ